MAAAAAAAAGPAAPIPTGGTSAATSAAASVLDEVLAANKAYLRSGQHTPGMALGVSRRLAVVTCMDSRCGLAGRSPQVAGGWRVACISHCLLGLPVAVQKSPCIQTPQALPAACGKGIEGGAAAGAGAALEQTGTSLESQPGPQVEELTRRPRRLLPEHFLGLRQGEAEVIRNGGGRVTEDVIRWAVRSVGRWNGEPGLSEPQPEQPTAMGCRHCLPAHPLCVACCQVRAVACRLCSLLVRGCRRCMPTLPFPPSSRSMIVAQDVLSCNTILVSAPAAMAQQLQQQQCS